MGFIEIDEKRFPLVLVTFEGSVPNDQFEQYLRGMDRMLSRRQPNVTILDATRSDRSPAVQRKMQADWIKTNREALEQYSCGTAFVISSPLVRGVLTAILWMQPLPQGYTVVATLAEAEDWAVGRLRQRGVEAPVRRTR